jgi:hypothetical protein
MQQLRHLPGVACGKVMKNRSNMQYPLRNRDGMAEILAAL